MLRMTGEPMTVLPFSVVMLNPVVSIQPKNGPEPPEKPGCVTMIRLAIISMCGGCQSPVVGCVDGRLADDWPLIVMKVSLGMS